MGLATRWHALKRNYEPAITNYTISNYLTAITSLVMTIPPNLPFSPQGAEIILGNIIEPEQLVIPVLPTASTMFGPRGAC